MIKGNARKKVKHTIEVLRHLSWHQGYAGLSVFDVGVSDDFEWTVQINLERDGLTLNRNNTSDGKDLEELLVYLLSQEVPD